MLDFAQSIDYVWNGILLFLQNYYIRCIGLIAVCEFSICSEFPDELLLLANCTAYNQNTIFDCYLTKLLKGIFTQNWIKNATFHIPDNWMSLIQLYIFNEVISQLFRILWMYMAASCIPFHILFYTQCMLCSSIQIQTQL